jgi:hypothetical protein
VDLYVISHICGFQVDALERDALEVLRLIRSVKNSLAPINRVPPEVLSRIPDYYDEDDTDTDKVLTALTHVCRGWRDTFISRASLWTRFDFTNIDKTRTYIERSKSSPLRFYLRRNRVTDESSLVNEVINDAFSLVIPHICRLKSLTVDVDYHRNVLKHLRCNVPLLDKLDFRVHTVSGPVLDELFGGDLSSLHELRLQDVATHFPWKSLANLRVVSLESSFLNYEITQILDFLESAPLLHTVLLGCRIPNLSDAPPERMVHLCHLKAFTIRPHLPQLTLLRHLHMPTGVSLTLELPGKEALFLDYLPERLPNFSNLSHITTINLDFFPGGRKIQLSGPNGSLRLLTLWKSRWAPLEAPSYAMESNILRSLSHPMLSKIQRLVISYYKDARPGEVEESPIYQMLSSADNLRTLVLSDCDSLPFILALDPEQNPFNVVLSSNMEALVFYFKSWSLLNVNHLIRMAKNRTSFGAKLSSIAFVDLNGQEQRDLEEVFKLRRHVTRVGYRVGDAPPAWDDIPDEVSSNKSGNEWV